MVNQIDEHEARRIKLLQEKERLDRLQAEFEAEQRELEGTEEWREHTKRLLALAEAQVEALTASQEEAQEQARFADEALRQSRQELGQEMAEKQRISDELEDLRLRATNQTDVLNQTAKDLQLAETERDSFKQTAEDRTNDLKKERAHAAILEQRLGAVRASIGPIRDQRTQQTINGKQVWVCQCCGGESEGDPVCAIGCAVDAALKVFDQANTTVSDNEITARLAEEES